MELWPPGNGGLFGERLVAWLLVLDESQQIESFISSLLRELVVGLVPEFPFGFYSKRAFGRQGDHTALLCASVLAHLTDSSAHNPIRLLVVALSES